MKILLLGGNGFVGEHLAARLEMEAACEIKIVGRSSATDKKTNYIQLDLSKYDQNFQVVVDWAEVIVVLTQDDVVIVDNLITAVRSCPHQIRIIYLSTLLLYEDSDAPRDESAPVSPKADYEQSKFEEEKKLMRFVAEFSAVKLCIVRMSNVYGDVKNRGVINVIFRAALSSGSIIINCNEDSVRDYIFIDDAVEYLVLLIQREQKDHCEIMNICTGKVYSVLEVIKNVEGIVGSKISYNKGPMVLEKRKIIGDNRKIISILLRFQNLTQHL